MNFFNKPKQPLTNSSSSSSSPPQTPHLFLQQAFTSLQANVSNFLQNALPKPPSPSSSESPAWARVSNFNNILNTAAASSATGRSTRGNDAMSSAAIKERLAGVPVYALTSPGEEFVLVSPVRSETSLGLFCLSEADATALLNQMTSIDPSMRKGSRVVPVALNEVVQLKVDGVAFRLIPEASQVMNAIKERKRNGTSDNETFRGVPVFQSKSLALRSDDKRYRPVFFRKEDLERSLSRASKEQNLLNPTLKGGDIQVSVLEDIIQGMKDSSTSTWNDVVFIPPGFDVSTNPPRG
ncbi:protein TIC 22-like, chloroplastic [Ipomoea triloba]|uniref:protein TIC 22-like, chloroplastic n=1 Tax=Ipomoea triloba TaxID=35885 RepID=UPI00125D9141|nr:protein TIC 22-like, chloroplastic [Ipomoea triloba]